MEGSAEVSDQKNRNKRAVQAREHGREEEMERRKRKK